MLHVDKLKLLTELYIFKDLRTLFSCRISPASTTPIRSIWLVGWHPVCISLETNGDNCETLFCDAGFSLKSASGALKRSVAGMVMAVSMKRQAHVHHAQADCSDNTFKFLTAGHIGRDTEIIRLTVHSFMFGILRNSQLSVSDSATCSHVWTSHLFLDLVNSVIAMVTHSAEAVQIKKKGRRVSGTEICLIQSSDCQKGERMMQKILALCAVCRWHLYQNQLTMESQVIQSEQSQPTTEVSMLEAYCFHFWWVMRIIWNFCLEFSVLTRSSFFVCFYSPQKISKHLVYDSQRLSIIHLALVICLKVPNTNTLFHYIWSLQPYL